MKHLIVIDDDLDLQEFLTTYFSQRKYQVTAFSSAQEAFVHRKILESADAILCDLIMQGMDGISLVRETREWGLSAPIILMTASKEVDHAIAAIEAGAFDYAIKPLHLEQLSVAVKRAVRFSELHQENAGLKTALKHEDQSIPFFVGKSPATLRVTEQAKRVAKSSSSILICGESGTGKDVLARSIHHMSERAKKPFVAINCSAIPENLLESELFGHAKGAFTGAVDKKIGLFEEANGGSIFLDEIGDMNYQLQSKLLRVIQERKVRRVGENQDIDIDVRVISATHKNLQQLIAENKFREDLYYRLNVIPIMIPPLRERREDIFPLSELFLKKYNAANGKSIQGIGRGAFEYLYGLHWKGNVRELENTIERAVILCEGRQIETKDLDVHFTGQETASLASTSHLVSAPLPINSYENSPPVRPPRPVFFSIEQPMDLETLSKEYILFILDKNRGSKEKTYRELGIDRKTLYRKLSQFNSEMHPMPESGHAPMAQFQ